MKYSLAAASLLAIAAADSVANQVITGLTSETQNLDTQINAYNGGAGEALQSASATLVSSIESGDKKIVAAGPLSSADALSLAGSVQSLSSAVKQAVGDIVGKKSQFVAAGQGSKVYSALVAQQSASAQLSKDLIAQVPSDLQTVGQNLAAPIAAALSSGVAAYADATGAVSSSAAASSTAASSAGSSAASSAASSAVTSAASATSSATVTSVVPVSTPATNGTTPVVTPSASPSPIATGAAGKVELTAGAAALAFLAVLAL